MSTQRPDVTDEDIGMRAFHTRRGKAVERAVERLRHGLGTSWGAFTPHEIEEMEWVLGELWSYMARTEWEELRFGNMCKADVRQLLVHGGEIRSHTRAPVEVLREVAELVRARSCG